MPFFNPLKESPPRTVAMNSRNNFCKELRDAPRFPSTVSNEKLIQRLIKIFSTYCSFDPPPSSELYLFLVNKLPDECVKRIQTNLEVYKKTRELDVKSILANISKMNPEEQEEWNRWFMMYTRFDNLKESKLKDSAKFISACDLIENINPSTPAEWSKCFSALYFCFPEQFKRLFVLDDEILYLITHQPSSLNETYWNMFKNEFLVGLKASECQIPHPQKNMSCAEYVDIVGECARDIRKQKDNIWDHEWFLKNPSFPPSK